MKMIGFIPILTSVCLTLPTLSVTAYAENLDKDTILKIGTSMMMVLFTDILMKKLLNAKQNKIRFGSI